MGYFLKRKIQNHLKMIFLTIVICYVKSCTQWHLATLCIMYFIDQSTDYYRQLLPDSNCSTSQFHAFLIELVLHFISCKN